MTYVVVSLDRSGSGPLLRALRGARLLPPLVHPWGSHHAYEELLTEPRSLAILDVPDERWRPGLEHRVGLLRRLAPVIALVPEGTDAADLLDAGADNVLTRNMPIQELVARLATERRSLATATPVPHSQGSLPASMLPHHGSQRLLLRLLLRDGRPWCCHDLSRLLGTAEQPLNRAALRARLDRLSSCLEPLGLALTRSGAWKRLSYTVVPSAGDRATVRP
ncbi:response regulator transcription factor [Streptomyces sp. HC44]|uniref:Response regulator transcription factor n=1 Tax=Streptomyces scabichelini TaxID=2711217 RepID=A0A6G4UZF4_9ACTN|nr:response regulator transcription factor [Streptomyces scabichelini]NGO07168.1 response regulator transcription factor [Streptomyces scabichelini]